MKKENDESFGRKVKSIEKELAKGFIRWRFRRSGIPPVDEETLDRGTDRVIDQAHTIAKERGKSILDELKQAKEEFQKAYRGEKGNSTKKDEDEQGGR